MRRATVVAWAAAALLGCDAGGGEATPTAPDASGSAKGSPATAWPVTDATVKTPAYGVSCRLAVDDVVTVASNGAADDALTLSAPASGPATLSLTVTGAGGTFEAQVTAARALLGKSYREATGTASLGGQSWTVVDGTLCFAEKLATGQAVEGELSLILARPEGGHQSVAGTFTLPGAAVDAGSDPTTVAATALDVDLR